MSIIRNFYKIKPPSALVNWDLSSAVLVDSGTMGQGGYSMFFSPDGLKFYTTSDSTSIYQYNLSTAWDLSGTGAGPDTSATPGEGQSSISGCTWSQDGTKMFATGLDGSGICRAYDASAAPWDLGALHGDFSIARYQFGITDGFYNSRHVWFREDGLKLYMVENTQGHYEYDLSTAWDIDPLSMSYSGNTFSTAAFGNQAFSSCVSSAGGTYFAQSVGSTVIGQYDLSPDWSLSPTPTKDAFEITFTGARGIYVSPDGTKLFVCNSGRDWAEYSMTPIPA